MIVDELFEITPIFKIDCAFIHPEDGAEVVDDKVAICYSYLVDECEKSMIKCRRAHRSKSFEDQMSDQMSDK